MASGPTRFAIARDDKVRTLGLVPRVNFSFLDTGLHHRATER